MNPNDQILSNAIRREAETIYDKLVIDEINLHQALAFSAYMLFIFAVISKDRRFSLVAQIMVVFMMEEPETFRIPLKPRDGIQHINQRDYPSTGSPPRVDDLEGFYNSIQVEEPNKTSVSPETGS
jgi:hypothetical protein